MALRIRKDGRVVSADQYPEREGDTYIPDAHHYALAEYIRAEETEADREWADAYGHFVETGSREKIEAWRAKHPEPIDEYGVGNSSVAPPTKE